MGMGRAAFPSTSATIEGFTTSVADPSTYMDRDGYDSNFHGVDISMPVLPNVWLSDRAPVTCPRRPGEEVFDLLYTHFSVVTSKSRRMPYFSCVNIDGRLEKRLGRSNTDWRRDPRIHLDYQLLSDGIYGRSGDGLFSRGHMTRREDPNWGTTALAQKADTDTFHVTNACPQFQTFNAPVWLALEDYVKNNAWRDDMRVSVFTGPLFDDQNDPEYAPPGLPPIQVPSSFWKVVIFRHDQSGDLAATAYMTSQAAQLPGRNRVSFVFGAFKDYQLRIEDLEEETQLTFPGLKEVDVLKDLSKGFRVSHADVRDVILSP